MRYDLRAIMTRAWRIFRKAAVSFAEALHRAWLSAKAEPVNAERIEAVKRLIGLEGQTVRTWAGWKALGREVIHGSKALFQAVLIYGSKGDGVTYTGSFFGESQTEEVIA